MADDDAFLRAIIDNPDDDVPRLVYADYLDEHGDPERAEFIRAQCAVERLPPSDPECDRLYDRSEDLLAANRERWLGPIDEFVDSAKFRRVFVHHVSLDA